MTANSHGTWDPNVSNAPGPSRPGSPPRWGIGDAAIAFVIGLVAAIAMGVVYPLFTGITDPDVLLDDANFTISTAAVQQVVTIAACFALVAAKGGRPLASLGCRFRWIDLLAVPVGVIAAIAAGLIVQPIFQLGDETKQRVVEQLNEATGASKVGFALMVLIGAPVSEELLFRGVLARSLQRRYSSMVTVGATGGIFAVVHALDPNAVKALPALFLFGMALTWAALRTGRIGTSICMHVGFNLLAVIQA